MSSIANKKHHGAGGGEWQTVTDAIPCDMMRQTPDLFHNQVIESWAEQSWAEFCMELDKPAFLLPITGFAEL